MQRRLTFEAPFAQLLGNQICGKRGRVDRRPQARPQPSDCAYMVLVGVREDDGVDLVSNLLQIGGIRHDQVDARRRCVAKGYADIHHDPAPVVRRTVGIGVEIHADFPASAERREDQFCVFHQVLAAERGVLRSNRISRPRMVMSASKWSMLRDAP